MKSFLVTVFQAHQLPWIYLNSQYRIYALLKYQQCIALIDFPFVTNLYEKTN